MPTVPVLQTAADLSASQIAGAASALVPTGVVLPFAGSSAPAGWLLCSGQEISQTTYAGLYDVLSTAYNLQINPTTGIAWDTPTAGTFRVPDYRGSFLRGVGTALSKDATTLGGYQGEKTAKNGLAVSGGTATLTGTTTFAASGHQHTLSTTGSDNLVVQAVTTGGVNKAIQTNTVPGTDLRATTAGGGTATVTISSTAASLGAGDNETRPLNKGVNYIIKT